MNEIKTSLSQLRNIRLSKIEQLKKKGLDPYPAKVNRKEEISSIINDYDKWYGKNVCVAGRLMSWREHGQLVFGHVHDQNGKIQLYIKLDTLKKASNKLQNLGFNDLHLLDVGDFVEAQGIVTKTERGEISILVNILKIITKAIRPLPDKWKSITDKETRYRRRYLDLTMNRSSMEMFTRKSKFWDAVREFFKNKGFIEVETPVLEFKTGGADAKPFVTHHNDLNIDLYLRISTELYQKRLVGGGFEKIYTLGPNFRNEGVDDEHVQEYQALEWYWAYADYRDNMELTKELFRYIALKVYGKTIFETRGYKFDLSDEWAEIDYVDIIKEKLGIDIFKDDEKKMLDVIKENHISLSGDINRNRLIDNLWKMIRKDISGPAFLINEPKFMSPLAKSRKDRPELTERFHIIIAGSELGNGYSEINDPIDQLERFKEQEEARLKGDDESQMLDIDYVEMLEYGMPPTSGFGMSERFFWYLEDISAREGSIFPLMKEEIDNSTKEIYPELFKSNRLMVKRQDKTKKMVLVLDKTLNGWQLTNTIGHLTAYLGSKIGLDLQSRPQFKTKDNKYIPANSQYPIITLSAKSFQLLSLMMILKEDNLNYLIYIDEMIKFSDDEQLAKIIERTDIKDIKILGIGIFGNNDKINKLTKKFSLWK